MKLKALLFLVVLYTGLSPKLYAQIPQMISYQGYVADIHGPLNGPASVNLALFDAISAGAQVWSQSYTGVTVTGGYYSVLMNFDKPDFSKPYWLEVTVNGVLMSPRVQMTASPYAMNARVADSAIHIPQAPVGTINAYAGTALTLTQEEALGWYVCDGQAISVADHPAYVAAVGETYGLSDDRKSVYLPDYRGMFLRGVNENRSDEFADPDASNRKSMAHGANSGDKVGSVQIDDLASHTHGAFSIPGGGSTPGGFTLGTGWLGPWNGKPDGSGTNYAGTISATGGKENRPKNAYVYWLIKVR